MLKIKKDKQLDTVVTIYEFVAIWCELVEITEIKNHRNKGDHHENLISLFIGKQKPPTVLAKYSEATLFGCELIQLLSTDKKSGLFTISIYDRFYRFNPNDIIEYQAALRSADHITENGYELYFDGYVISSLAKWILEQYDIPDKLMPDWAKQLIEKPEQTTVDINGLGNNSDYVKVSELSKTMEFMIKCQKEATYQHSHTNNKDVQLTKFKSETVNKIMKLSVQEKLTHTKSLKTRKGLNETQVKYIFDFIQKK